MANSFFAVLSRMKYIVRWGLMRNTRPENLAEHAGETAVLAHALAVLRNRRFGGNVDEGRAALLGLYHDAAEVFTGDLPTPVKYYSGEIRDAYKTVESSAVRRLLSRLPEDLRPSYAALLQKSPGDEELRRLVKAADKLSALIKCLEEENAGSNEFRSAARAQLEALHAMELPEAECFLAEFLPAYRLTLDEQERNRPAPDGENPEPK